MSDDGNPVQPLDAIVEGLDKDNADISQVLLALQQTPLNYFELVKEASVFLKDLTFTETPTDPDEIQNLSKEEVIFATYRANFFEKIRMPSLDDEQLEYLLIRTHQIWGEHPTEPVGRWVDWSLWTHLNRRRNGIPVTEVVAGDRTAREMKEAWVNRHHAREEQRRLHKVDNYDRYETPEEVPKSLQQIIMSPFIENPDMANTEIDIRDSKGEDKNSSQKDT